MANAKSIIDIDVNSDAFKEFKARFDEYQSTLSKMGAQWAGVGAAAAEAGSKAAGAFAPDALGLAAMTASLSKIIQQQQNVEQGAKHSNTAFKDLAASAKSVSDYVERTTFQLLKWAALGGIAGAATGLFGAEKLAQEGADLTNDARLLNATPGQITAAKDVYQPLGVDSESLLRNVKKIQNEPEKQYLLNYLGIAPDQSAADYLPKILKALAVESGRGQQQYVNEGLGDVLDFQEADSFRRLDPKEIDRAADLYDKSSKDLNIKPKTSDNLTELDQTFALAASTLKKIVMEDLAALSPKLEELSNSIIGTILKINSSLMDPNKSWFDKIMDFDKQTTFIGPGTAFDFGIPNGISGDSIHDWFADDLKKKENEQWEKTHMHLADINSQAKPKTDMQKMLDSPWAGINDTDLDEDSYNHAVSTASVRARKPVGSQQQVPLVVNQLTVTTPTGTDLNHTATAMGGN